MATRDEGTHIRSYRDLIVWQCAMEVAESVYELTRALPPDERFGLTLQLRRASVSVPSNLAEGWGRGQRREYAHFVRIARGSLCEVETQLLLVSRLGFLEPGALEPTSALIERTGRLLINLLRALTR